MHSFSVRVAREPRPRAHFGRREYTSGRPRDLATAAATDAAAATTDAAADATATIAADGGAVDDTAIALDATVAAVSPPYNVARQLGN